MAAEPKGQWCKQPKYFPKRNTNICSHEYSERRTHSGFVEESKLEKANSTDEWKTHPDTIRQRKPTHQKMKNELLTQETAWPNLRSMWSESNQALKKMYNCVLVKWWKMQNYTDWKQWSFGVQMHRRSWVGLGEMRGFEVGLNTLWTMAMVTNLNAYICQSSYFSEQI